jgi:ribosomal 50S subunit-recycling heat shock protein
MRLDYFLKISRIVKRRPLAKEMCDKHLVQVNDQAAKAGKEVKEGDIITVTLRNRMVKVRVEQLPPQAVSKKDAASVYTMLAEIQIKEEALP